MKKLGLVLVLTLTLISGLFAESKVVCYKEGYYCGTLYSVDILQADDDVYVRLWNNNNHTMRCIHVKDTPSAIELYTQICSDDGLIKANVTDPVKKEDIVQYAQSGDYLVFKVIRLRSSQ